MGVSTRKVTLEYELPAELVQALEEIAARDGRAFEDELLGYLASHAGRPEKPSPEEVERRNESYRKFLQELDFTRAQLLSVITAHADRLEDVRQVMREMSERVQKRQEPGPADTGQNPSAIVFPVAVPGPPDQDSVQYQPGLPWPDVE